MVRQIEALSVEEFSVLKTCYTGSVQSTISLYTLEFPGYQVTDNPPFQTFVCTVKVSGLCAEVGTYY